MSIHNKRNNHQRRQHDNREKPSGNIWIYGKHAVMAALANPNRKILRAVATKSMADEIKELVKLNLQIVDGKALSNILGEGSVHQGVALEVKPLPEVALEDIFAGNPKLIVILDQVTDPHNVGAVLRSCAAFDVDALVMPKDNSPPENTTIAKTASGALEVVPLVRVTNLASAMRYIQEQGFWCLGLDGSAQTELKDAPDYDKVALVMGAEGAGLRRLTSETCDMLVKLPISGKVESLNVSNAAAIALYEMGRGK